MHPTIDTYFKISSLFLLFIHLTFAQEEITLENGQSQTNSTFAKYTLIELNSSSVKCTNAVITDLFIITHTNSDVAHLVPPGYNYIPADLNKGAKGKHIYLAVRKSCSALNLQLSEWNDSRPPKYGPLALIDRPHVLLKLLPNSQGYSFPGADLNEGAGGNYIYWYYTRESDLFLKDIYVMTANYPSASCDYGYSKSSDLNKGCGASTPYIHFCLKIIR